MFSRFRRSRAPEPEPDPVVEDGAFDAFDAAFGPPAEVYRDRGWTLDDTTEVFGVRSAVLTEFLARHARATYLDGLLRIALPGGRFDPRTWNGRGGWADDWPKERELAVFAYDWLGRLYGVDRKGQWGTAGTVTRLATGADALESTGQPLDGWLVETLPGDRDAILRAEDYRAWLHGGRPLDTESCASYRTPLGLGGADRVANLERTSLVVHLSISGQLAGQIRDLPPGTTISGITLS